jgi:hypothetical protein
MQQEISKNGFELHNCTLVRIFSGRLPSRSRAPEATAILEDDPDSSHGEDQFKCSSHN